MTRGRSTARGTAIADQTAALARQLGHARARYWAALLARPQLAAPIVHAIRGDADGRGIETAGHERGLLRLLAAARDAMKQPAHRTPHRRYRAAVHHEAQWLADVDRCTEAADGCYQAIALWARRAPGVRAWSEHRICRPRVQSRAWSTYWEEVDKARREREQLRGRIVLANEGLVIMLCNRWIPWAEGHLSREDLQQVAREGLFRAADKFDPERGWKFSTYAGDWCRHFVFRAHQTARSDVKAPSGIQQLALAIAPAVERDRLDPQELQAWLVQREAAKPRRKPRVTPWRPPGLDAIAAALEYLGVRQVSLDAPLGRDDDGRRATLGDLMADPSLLADEAIDRERVTARLLAAVQGLDPRAHEVVALRFGLRGEAMTVQAIAAQMGLRKAEILDLETQALAALRGQLQGAEHVTI